MTKNTLMMTVVFFSLGILPAQQSYAFGKKPPKPDTTPGAVAQSPNTTLAQADGTDTYTTSKGAVFTRVQGPGNFGKAWKDPSGTLWSADQGGYQYVTSDGSETAAEACTKIGGLIPHGSDYQTLISYFDTTSQGFLSSQGQKDLYAIFTDMDGGHYWTTTVGAYPFAPNGGDEIACAENFDSVYGTVLNCDRFYLTVAVRCVHF